MITALDFVFMPILVGHTNRTRRIRVEDNIHVRVVSLFLTVFTDQ